MALFDFLFKRKTDTPAPPVSEDSPPTQRPSENDIPAPPAAEAAEAVEAVEAAEAADEREQFLRDIRSSSNSSQRSSLLRSDAGNSTQDAAEHENATQENTASDPVSDGLEATNRPSENPNPSARSAQETAADATADEPTAAHTDTCATVHRPSENRPAADAATAETATGANPPAVRAEEPPAAESRSGWAARLKQGLGKSRDKMAKSLAGVFGGGKIDEDLYEELETVLLTSDMGIEATDQIMEDVRRRVSLKGLSDGTELRRALKESLYEMLAPLEKPLEIPDNGQPFVIMMAGINGAGKTTSIGKLAKYFQQQGQSVILAAGDTFRAAAREQLQEWGARNGVTVVSQEKGDAAAVCYDAVESAKARHTGIVLADTAGRLPTQLHLMEEIKKVKRVLQKAMPDAPHEIIVVLDANIGQNAVNQVIAFDDALGVTGLIVTKLDGTAKGGVLAALAAARPIPVRYIGVGEGIDDLRPFDARAFVDALIDG
ncbi:Cell division protein FtsY homolog [Kingella potus]|uniref:Signal recognition particle receptor FtsY n=1 Tax=Kingella potus TaxID=265175 RepID=A0A377QYT1_9NEIS|nr:signal recognition particle-docking protein FtsY [Kingella potus]UOP01944.1 signal recognition particle-docking protein FtsY [Kingella potus]STR00544.1 Cell division protein FtsY homolog [Kingella potus]